MDLQACIPAYLLMILCTSLVHTGCHSPKSSALPYYQEATLTPLWPGETDFDADTLHQIAHFSFRNQQNETFTQHNLDGKITVVNFFFTTCPSICPKMMKNLKQAIQELPNPESVQVVSHSVDPETDSVLRLQEYMYENKLDAYNWHLLTGSAKEIYHLARNSYFAEEITGLQKDSSEFLHTEFVFLLDAGRHLRGIYKGTLPLDLQRMNEDIIRLQKETYSE